MWLLKKSDSLSSIKTLLLTNILLLWSIPWIFDTTSFLVPISLTNATSHLTMKITKSNGWNTLFLSVMPQNSSPLIITPQSFHHLNLTWNKFSLAMHLPTPLLHAFLTLNMNKLKSMMLFSIKPTFHLISNAISLTSYQNTKNYLMAPWESILIKRFTSTSNLELNRCTIVLTSFQLSNGSLHCPRWQAWGLLVA